MNKQDIFKRLIPTSSASAKAQGSVFAPTNIALCKYWGKRDIALNLPLTSSLSIGLADKGALVRITFVDQPMDEIVLNGNLLAADNLFAQRLVDFLTLVRVQTGRYYRVEMELNIPFAAGLASSACGAAALVLALDQLHDWQFDGATLSVLARLGSGSAARSIWHGFVEWQRGELDDGMDSHGVLIEEHWPELRIGLHIVDSKPKPIPSRDAMVRTVQTSKLYDAWPKQVAADLPALKEAIFAHQIERLGEVAEANALAMHATMMSSWPPIVYSQPETLLAMHKVWELRKAGLPVYFTQDAGPNLKLIFPAHIQPLVEDAFDTLEIIVPF